MAKTRSRASEPKATLSAGRAVAVLGLAAAASLALSLLIASGQAQETPSARAPTLAIEWAFRPDSVDEMLKPTEAVALGAVEAVRPGTDLVVGPDVTEESAQTIPTQLIDVTVEQKLAGGVPDKITLYQVGGDGLHAEGDPAYEVGERYLLFLRRRLTDDLSAPNPDGTFLPVAPDGRFEILDSGRLDSPIPGAVATALDGATVSEAASEVEASEAEGR